MKLEGFLTISSLTDADGKPLSTQKAVDSGIIVPRVAKPSGWGIERHEIPLGYNMNVDNMRQNLAYLFGGRVPSANFSCSKFGIGTGTRAPNAGDTGLQSPLSFYDPGSGLTALKPVTGIDFPAPYYARVEFSLAANEAVGTVITEYGLYSDDSGGIGSTLLCRKVEQGLAKDSTYAPTFIWRIRF